MEENIIDYGKWTVPNGWNELTLKTFQEIERYYAEKEDAFDAREVLHILTNKTVDEVNALPMEAADKIMERLAWLSTKPEYGEPTNKIAINGETYMVNVTEKLKFGEYVATDNVMKSDKHNYAAILAILCRKEGEVYDSQFEAELFEQRMKMYEEQPMVNVMPLIFFFIELYLTSRTLTALYSQVMEAINLTAKSIESSQKIGAFKKLYMKWQTRKLRKLLESSKNT